MDISEGMQSAKPEGPATGSKDINWWLVNLSCALSAVGSTSVVSIAKFGVYSERLSASVYSIRKNRCAFKKARCLPNTRCKALLRNRPLQMSSISCTVSLLQQEDQCRYAVNISIYCAADETVSEDIVIQGCLILCPPSCREGGMQLGRLRRWLPSPHTSHLSPPHLHRNCPDLCSSD